MVEISGEIIAIIYKNEINGYTICSIATADDEDVTVVGFLPYVQEGEEIKAIGNWVNHPDYGKQLKAECFEKIMPKGISEIEKYLSSGVIKGVGLVTAKKLVKKFGEATIDVIRNTPERLVEVKGINMDRAIFISQTLNEQWNLWQLTSFLSGYGIGNKNILKLYKAFETQSLDMIKSNPYLILEICNGVAFKVADEIAGNVGIEENSNMRVAAGIKYVLTLASYEGHTHLPKDVLMNYLIEFLNIDTDSVESVLTSLAIEGKIRIYKENKIYLTPLFNAEKNIAFSIRTLSETKSRFNADKIITELDNGIKLTEEQENCVKSVFYSQVSVITGGPGTGKTTIIKAILKTLESYEAKVVLCAPTGRAAKRLSETAGVEAKTIHRLLEIKHIDDDDRNALVNLTVDPIDADVVIVDEVSMIDAVLMSNLLKAINEATTLILVGDVDQLPSVGAGNVLKDIIDSGEVNVFRLTKIFRQASESMIIVNAHSINIGEMPVFNEKNSDSFLVNASSYSDITSKLVNLVTERLPNFKECNSIEDIQVLTPMRKGALGANNLNKELQKALNPYASYKKQIAIGDKAFRVADKVMQIKNNYDLEWHNGIEKGYGVYNGDIGRIKAVNVEDETVLVEFDDGKEVEYDSTQLEELDHAFATTIHKSQGSEFPIVVIPVFMGGQRLMTRNLLYTAMTRAKELLVFVGNISNIEYMVRNVNKKERYSALKDMLSEDISM